jgi:heterodisulfide reductase subunit B
MKKEGKEQIWRDYQKEIPDNDYFYVRSCIRQNFFPASEKMFLKILRDDLGKNIYETEHHTTCGGIGYHSDVVPQETVMTIIARQFALMTEAGYKNYAASCITSFGLYSEILETWHHFPEVLARVQENLKKATGREFELPQNLAHASDIIYKLRHEIAEKAKYKLINHQTGQPLKVVEHIGCHYSKMFPHKGVGGAEYPYVLSGMIEAWGGEVIDYPERRHCCGFGFRQYLIQANRGYSLANTHKKFESMEPFQPDMIITNCPGCPYFLDRWQYVIAETEGKTYGGVQGVQEKDGQGQGIPVFTYEEVASLVMGYNPWDIGLQIHQTAVEPLLDKIGIKYDKSKKYEGLNGKDIGKPEMPKCIRCC